MPALTERKACFLNASTIETKYTEAYRRFRIINTDTKKSQILILLLNYDFNDTLNTNRLHK